MDQPAILRWTVSWQRSYATYQGSRFLKVACNMLPTKTWMLCVHKIGRTLPPRKKVPESSMQNVSWYKEQRRWIPNDMCTWSASKITPATGLVALPTHPNWTSTDQVCIGFYFQSAPLKYVMGILTFIEGVYQFQYVNCHFKVSFILSILQALLKTFKQFQLAR